METENTPLATLPSGLEQAEAEFVYNVEILDLPVKKAAQLADLPYSRVHQPHIVQARELVRTELRGNLQVTKEDATFGFKDAINRAKLLGEPMTEIAGWDRLVKLHGLDAPLRVDININASIEVAKSQVKTMTDADLVASLGAGGVIDAEFYEIEKNGR